MVMPQYLSNLASYSVLVVYLAKARSHSECLGFTLEQRPPFFVFIARCRKIITKFTVHDNDDLCCGDIGVTDSLLAYTSCNPVQKLDLACSQFFNFENCCVLNKCDMFNHEKLCQTSICFWLMKKKTVTRFFRTCYKSSKSFTWTGLFQHKKTKWSTTKNGEISIVNFVKNLFTENNNHNCKLRCN